MSQDKNIRVDPQELRDTGTHFQHASADIQQLAADLRHATAGLDTGAWTGDEAARLSARFAEAETLGRRRAAIHAELGDLLFRAADAFEEADGAPVELAATGVFNSTTTLTTLPVAAWDSLVPPPAAGGRSEWDWQNRWYNAHGYFWDPATGGWSTVGDPVFADLEIAREVIAAAGIELGGWAAWSADNIEKVAFGVAKFGQALGGGIPALKDLLGGSATIQLTEKTDFYCGWGKAHCAPPRLARGGGTWVLLQESSFDNMGLHRGAQLVVHELAHVMDWQNNLSLSWMKQHDPLTDYAANPADLPIVARPKWEVWAEAVTVYVFGHYDAHGDYVSDYKAAEVNRRIQQYGIDINLQMHAMQVVLEGW